MRATMWLSGDDDVSPLSRGFRGRRTTPAGEEGRVPPGQYVTRDFPVLSAGPTPHTTLQDWSFSIKRNDQVLQSWTWPEIHSFPIRTVTADIHCVTRWSKLDTEWDAVSLDDLLSAVGATAGYVLAFSDGGYTTNLPLADVSGGQAWLAFGFGGEPLPPEHGGPARLLVPHLYFWKSAKWVRGLELLDSDEPGFWETYGYHMYGDPWREQRYAGD
jgi:DMSO/TMAO reductase YedYZ molybdopterin-dependent catalytic subunit